MDRLYGEMVKQEAAVLTDSELGSTVKSIDKINPFDFLYFLHRSVQIPGHCIRI
jgi:hypothetical protein